MNGGPLFFYGTLLDPDIRRAVAGRELGLARPACVLGFRRRLARGRHYPILLPRQSCRVAGLAFDGIDGSVLARLTAYEGPEYRLAPVPLIDAAGRRTSGLAFLPRRGVLAAPLGWSLPVWQRRHKRALLRCLWNPPTPTPPRVGGGAKKPF